MANTIAVLLAVMFYVVLPIVALVEMQELKNGIQQIVRNTAPPSAPPKIEGTDYCWFELAVPGKDSLCLTGEEMREMILYYREQAKQ